MANLGANFQWDDLESAGLDPDTPIPLVLAAEILAPTHSDTAETAKKLYQRFTRKEKQNKNQTAAPEETMTGTRFTPSAVRPPGFDVIAYNISYAKVTPRALFGLRDWRVAAIAAAKPVSESMHRTAKHKIIAPFRVYPDEKKNSRTLYGGTVGFDEQRNLKLVT